MQIYLRTKGKEHNASLVHVHRKFNNSVKVLCNIPTASYLDKFTFTSTTKQFYVRFHI